ncbi:CAP domain-containing protein [Streptomyces bambusae]|uniref:CAP domain-containing protein n=1 Tax=Streptomyces bambusae TaxID=1550616 RepID=UPI001CFFF23A|nr:CAP domain-containing protein [Streptomyces bambusae]MCB5169072.1 CAP domain-containing protein [Streptomyces bambusae]
MRARTGHTRAVLLAAAAGLLPALVLPGVPAAAYAAAPWQECGSLGSDAYDRPPPADPGRFGFGVLPATGGVYCLINAERRRLGLQELEDSGQLREAANKHVTAALAQKWWGDKKDPHRNPQVAGTREEQISNRIRGEGYCAGGRSWRNAEITYNGWGGQGTPRAAVNWWLYESKEGHAEIIRDPAFTQIGIAPRGGAADPRGAGFGDAGTYVVTFGRCEA